MTETTNRFDPEDARLTAYALGELDADEARAVEVLLEADAQAAAFVEDLRAVAGRLEGALGVQDAPMLSAEQRARIERGLTRRPKLARRLIALAAGSVLALGLVWVLGRGQAENSMAPFTYRIWGTPTSGVRQVYQGRSGLNAFDPAASRNGLRAQHPETLAQYRELGYGGGGGTSGEEYTKLPTADFKRVALESLSTFSIDVDSASYATARRYILSEGRLPPPDSVRLEEFVNYFDYARPEPVGDVPFALGVEVADCPWAPEHRLVRIDLAARELAWASRPASNLVFLVDVSGSMSGELALLVRGLKLLVENLDERDRVSIVVYAGASGLVLPPTSCIDAWAVMDALDSLKSGGSTAGSAGIQLAYETARETFVEGGLNRVILCTDGDFNVGVTDRDELIALIEQKRAGGVELSVLGFGRGNVKDATMESLAQHGNGNYAYIDSIGEMRRVLVEQAGGTLRTLARDVKIQVEFNPLEVESWRQLGYENRALASEDFEDDSVDAGELGSGHTITAFYEVVPAGAGAQLPSPSAPVLEGQRYQDELGLRQEARTGELLHLALRYKEPGGDGVSQLVERPVLDEGRGWRSASADFRLAAGVAAFAMKLRGEPFGDEIDWELVVEMVRAGLDFDPRGYRRELLRTVETARRLTTKGKGRR